MQSFISVGDVNLDFWPLSPPQAWRTTEKAGPDRVNVETNSLHCTIDLRNRNDLDFVIFFNW